MDFFYNQRMPAFEQAILKARDIGWRAFIRHYNSHDFALSCTMSSTVC